ncbi:hypothetical protein HMPREF0004_1170 [Achromobacter piechaudii ATCC 43553]|uniref:Uncharacterized protein n=1 Tax=Achromobacter piechaudii ATCC 43553 TaxID=742159 RepID=D4X6S3_9BURK|nr:hypothetical protein HMPREF0004_1170 [Achromobacter piechaudii ATCC 43553]
MRPATPQANHDGRTSARPGKPWLAWRGGGGLPDERTGRYRAAMAPEARMGTVAGAAQAGRGACQPPCGRRGGPGGRLPVSRLPFARGGKCCVLASLMRRKHRFGAETVSPEGARDPVLLRSGLVFSAFFAF